MSFTSVELNASTIGADVVIQRTSGSSLAVNGPICQDVFGIDSSGNPYYDTSGPAPSDVATLGYDGSTGLLFLSSGLPPDPHLMMLAYQARAHFAPRLAVLRTPRAKDHFDSARRARPRTLRVTDAGRADRDRARVPLTIIPAEHVGQAPAPLRAAHAPDVAGGSVTDLPVAPAPTIRLPVPNDREGAARTSARVPRTLEHTDAGQGGRANVRCAAVTLPSPAGSVTGMIPADAPTVHAPAASDPTAAGRLRARIPVTLTQTDAGHGRREGARLRVVTLSGNGTSRQEHGAVAPMLRAPRAADPCGRERTVARVPATMRQDGAPQAERSQVRSRVLTLAVSHPDAGGRLASRTPSSLAQGDNGRSDRALARARTAPSGTDPAGAGRAARARARAHKPAERGR